jgi:hypothetical protein
VAYRGLLALATVPEMTMILRWLLAGPSTAGPWFLLGLRRLVATLLARMREPVEAPVGRAQKVR